MILNSFPNIAPEKFLNLCEILDIDMSGETDSFSATLTISF